MASLGLSQANTGWRCCKEARLRIWQLLNSQYIALVTYQSAFQVTVTTTTKKKTTSDLIYNLCLKVAAVPPGQRYTRSWHRWRGSSVLGGTAGGGGTPPPCHPERETGGWSRPLGGDRGNTWRLCLRERHPPPQFWQQPFVSKASPEERGVCGVRVTTK